MDAPRINLARPAATIFISFTIMLLAGCTTRPTNVSEMPPTPTVVGELSSPEPAIFPTDPPTPEPYASNQACVVCHTNKDLLISTASQVEDSKPESSGEG